MSEPPEAFTLTMRLTDKPSPFAFEGVILNVVFPGVVGVPESTHLLLRKRPGGSDGVWPHEDGAPKPASKVGESEFMGTFCTSRSVLKDRFVALSHAWLPETESGENSFVVIPPLPNWPSLL